MLGSPGGDEGALSVTSCWQLEFGDSAMIYSPEIGGHYKSKAFAGELLIKLLDLCEPDDIMLIVWRKKKNQPWEEYVLHRHLGKSDYVMFFGPWKAKHIQYHH